MNSGRESDRDHGCEQCAADEHYDAELGVGEGRRPLGGGEELHDGDFLEEADRLEDKDEDDAEGRQHREVGASHQQTLDNLLPQDPPAAISPPRPALGP